MRAALWGSILGALLLFAVSADACSVCVPNCQQAIGGVTGRVNCISSSSYCRIWGDLCAGGGGSGCECGMTGCNPCNPVCAPHKAEWQLVRVNVAAPRKVPQAEWTLVAVSTPRNRS